MRKLTLLFIGMALSACSTLKEPAIIAETPAMVSICVPDASPLQTVVDMAQRHCRVTGRDAELVSRDRLCTVRGLTFDGVEHTFRCVR